MIWSIAWASGSTLSVIGVWWFCSRPGWVTTDQFLGAFACGFAATVFIALGLAGIPRP